MTVKRSASSSDLQHPTEMKPLIQLSNGHGPKPPLDVQATLGVSEATIIQQTLPRFSAGRLFSNPFGLQLGRPLSHRLTPTIRVLQLFNFFPESFPSGGFSLHTPSLVPSHLSFLQRTAGAACWHGAHFGCGTMLLP